jgi:hypothetical protein
VRGCAVKISASLDTRFEVCGVIKAGTGTESISGSMKEEVDNLMTNDFLIISSGSNDISRNDSRLAFRNIVIYSKNVKHTIVILIGAYFRYDTSDCSHLNNSIKLSNNKLSKLAKFFNHVTISEMVNNRLLYTRQGSHLNCLAKKYYQTS